MCRGFLLHGPPGCGKTLLAHAIAGELELPFIKISAPEIVSGVSGDSEKKLRELFDQARRIRRREKLFLSMKECRTKTKARQSV